MERNFSHHSLFWVFASSFFAFQICVKPFLYLSADLAYVFSISLSLGIFWMLFLIMTFLEVIDLLVDLSLSSCLAFMYWYQKFYYIYILFSIEWSSQYSWDLYSLSHNICSECSSSVVLYILLRIFCDQYDSQTFAAVALFLDLILLSGVPMHC